jgi:hypothetical protein
MYTTFSTRGRILRQIEKIVVEKAQQELVCFCAYFPQSNVLAMYSQLKKAHIETGAPKTRNAANVL